MGRLVLLVIVLIAGTIILACIADDITDGMVSEWLKKWIEKHLPKIE